MNGRRIMKKIKYFIPLFVVLLVNVAFIPVDIIKGFNIVSIVDLILILVNLLIINSLSLTISKNIMIIQTRKLSKNELEQAEDKILKKRKLRKYLWLSFLLGFILLIIYLIILL